MSAEGSVRLLVVSLLGLALLAPIVAPALAHPGGGLLPPHARFSADGDVVRIEWTAPQDDAAHVGEAVGIFPEGTMEAFLSGPEELLPTDEQIRELSRSPELETYLLDHVEVRQDGVACDGQVDPAEDFLADGAEFAFQCREPIEQVDVRITILLDQDPRYDTFGVDGTVWTVLFTSAQPEHTWDAEAAAQARAGSLPTVLLVGLGVVVLLAVAWWLYWQRVRRVRRAPRTYGAGGVSRRARSSTKSRRRSRITVGDR